MVTRTQAIEYVNLLARALSVVSEFPSAYNRIFAIKNFAALRKETREQLEAAWSEDTEVLLKKLNDVLAEIEQETERGHRIAGAFAFCEWLDFHMTYGKAKRRQKLFSLWALIPYTCNEWVIVEALNDNYEKTGIWINPKFKVAQPYVERGEEVVSRSVANRDVFEGVNGWLENCSYIPWNTKNKVKNVIIAYDVTLMSDKLRIAFAPMTDRKDVIKLYEEKVTRQGIEFTGDGIAPIAQASTLLERLKADWHLAANHAADIFFAPELLGTDLFEENHDDYNDHVFKWSESRLKQGEEVPGLTIFPTLWKNRRNRATVLSYDGEILAMQEKYIPFVNVATNKIEALEEPEVRTTVIIHIPGVHRIAIVICAEFLAKEVQQVQNYICGSLGATLLLVPSYSGGEQDFLNELSSLAPYGTTVIWGNCCGAIRSDEKAIGGCGVAGMREDIVFGEKCNETCRGSCKGISACVFLVDIPLKFRLDKTKKSDPITYVEHCIERRKYE